MDFKWILDPWKIRNTLIFAELIDRNRITNWKLRFWMGNPIFKWDSPFKNLFTINNFSPNSWSMGNTWILAEIIDRKSILKWEIQCLNRFSHFQIYIFPLYSSRVGDPEKWHFPFINGISHFPKGCVPFEIQLFSIFWENREMPIKGTMNIST